MQATIEALTIAEARARGLPEEAPQSAVPKSSRMQTVEAQLMGMLQGGTLPSWPICCSFVSTINFLIYGSDLCKTTLPSYRIASSSNE